MHDPKEVEAFKSTILKAFDVKESVCAKHSDADKRFMTIVKRQNNRRILNMHLVVEKVFLRG